MFIEVQVPYGTSVVVEIANEADQRRFFTLIQRLLQNGDRVTLDMNSNQEGLETMSVDAFDAWIELFGDVMLLRHKRIQEQTK